MPTTTLREEVRAAAPAAALTSLDTYAENGEWEQPGRFVFNGREACPRRRDVRMLDRDTGELAAASCDAQSCPHCLRRHVRELPALIAMGRPERSLTLTLLPDDWQQTRWQVRDFVRRVRGAGYRLEMAWTTERTKAGVRHLHAATHGDYIPQAEVQERWGGRYVWVNRIRGDGGAEGWGHYLGKMVEGGTWANYLAKSATEHVADNGGRIVHVTRGFYRGQTLSHNRAILRGRSDPEGDSSWQLVRVAELEALGAAARTRRLERAGECAAA